VGPYYQNSQTKITDIQDGTSNTIGFGEVTSGNDSFFGLFAHSWMGASGLPTAWGLPSAGQPAQSVQYNSFHGNIINFAFCDGSVRPISRSVDQGNFDFAAGMQDGFVISYSALGQ
jgi:prepilin-type processing-associated H-X9-DG protein